MLCAGGIRGALYEVGILRAFEEKFGPLDRRFDLFLGVSAGATVAALVMQGLGPGRLYRAMIDGDDPIFLLRQRDVVQFDLRRATRLAVSAGRCVLASARRLVRPRSTVLDDAADVERALPAGLLTLEPYRRFLARTLRQPGFQDDFRALPKRLFIPATDLDSGRRIVFGEPPWDDVPISTAIAASSAIPIFFEPFEVRGRYLIDGHVGKVGHLDLLLGKGATRALLINPLVPMVNEPDRCLARTRDGRCPSLRERGMLGVWSQATRIESYVRLHLGIRRFKAENPGLVVQLVEPDGADATMALARTMSLDVRREVLEIAYRQGLDLIRTRQGEYEAFFEGVVPARIAR